MLIPERVDAAIARAPAWQLNDDAMLARLRLCLQLPRLSYGQLAQEELLLAELAAVRHRIHTEQAPVASWRALSAPGALLETTLRVVPDSVALTIHRVFHYIGSERTGIHLGIYGHGAMPQDVPLALLSFSRFDVASLGPAVAQYTTPARTLVLSRAYAFPGTPRNWFSYGFKRALDWFHRRELTPDLILTYVNPNVGFTGASYLASNWHEFAIEHEVTYDYVDEHYITRRELIARAGSSGEAGIEAYFGARHTRSRVSLLPLRVFAFSPLRALRRSLANRRASTIEF